MRSFQTIFRMQLRTLARYHVSCSVASHNQLRCTCLTRIVMSRTERVLIIPMQLPCTVNMSSSSVLFKWCKLHKSARSLCPLHELHTVRIAFVNKVAPV